jgi:hypothetical protein
MDTANTITAQDLTPFALSSDWRAGPATPQLWAVAGDSPDYQSTGATPQPFVLRYSGGAWTQLLPNPNLSVDWPRLNQGAPDVPQGNVGGRTPVPQVVAAEPNENAAWIAVVPSNAERTEIALDRIQVTTDAAGTVTGATVEQVSLGPISLGAATAITCPAEADCWMATSQGWLFHLTNGTQLSPDTDPNFAGVITYRPPDGGTPSVIPPVELGTSIPPSPAPTTQSSSGHTTPLKCTRKQIVTHMSKSHLTRRTVLVLSFTLTAKARVQLIARRGGTIVAETKRSVLSVGRHMLELALDIKRWPTKLSLKADGIGKIGTTCRPATPSNGTGSTAGTGNSAPTVVSS